MGFEFIPDEVISVQDLGLSDYPPPCTMAGKVLKTKLAEVVQAYRSSRYEAYPWFPLYYFHQVLRIKKILSRPQNIATHHEQ